MKLLWMGSADAVPVLTGFECEPVHDAWTALDRIRQERPAAVLCDNPAPWTVEEFLEAVHRIDGRLPVVVRVELLGHAADLVALASRLTRLGAAAVVAPAADEDLARQLTHLLASHKQPALGDEPW